MFFAAEEELRGITRLSFGMVDLVVFALVEDDFLVAVLAVLDADRAEERGQLEILVLRPLLERMIVALRAHHAHAQKELRGGLHRHLGIAVKRK